MSQIVLNVINNQSRKCRQKIASNSWFRQYKVNLSKIPTTIPFLLFSFILSKCAIVSKRILYFDFQIRVYVIWSNLHYHWTVYTLSLCILLFLWCFLFWYPHNILPFLFFWVFSSIVYTLISNYWISY